MSGASEVPAIPEDVRKLADDVAASWRALTYPSKVVLSDDVARAIMAALAARPVDTGREKALSHAQGIAWFEQTFCVPLGDKPGAVDVAQVRALANPENGRG